MNPVLQQFIRIGLGLAKQQIPQIATIEAMAKRLPSLTGAEKQKEAVELVVASFLAAEEVSGKALVEDSNFQRGVRMVNDGYVLILRAIQDRHVIDGTAIY